MSNNIPSRYNWIFGYANDLVIDNKDLLIKNYFDEGLRKLLGIFHYKTIPKTISPRTIELFILSGYAKVFKYKNNWYVGNGAFSGVYNYNYMPVSATITNTFLKYSETLTVCDEFNKDDAKRNIEKYCFIIPNDELYSGLYNKIREYAEIQAECVLTLKFILYNNRIPTISVSNNQTIKESFDKLYKNIVNGKTYESLTGNSVFESLKTYPIMSSSQLNQIKEVIECMQYNSAKFDNFIGLNSNYNMKRENISSDEAKLNDDELLPQIDELFECRQRAYNLINEVANEKVFDIDLKSSWKIKRDEIDLEIEYAKNEIEQLSNDDNNNNDESKTDEGESEK